MRPTPPLRFQVHKATGRTVDTDAWQRLEMAELYRCIADFDFDHTREVFRITELDGQVHTLMPEHVCEAYADAIVAMVDSRIAHGSGPEFTTETGVRMRVDPVPYVPNIDDRREVYPRHWDSPHR